MKIHDVIPLFKRYALYERDIKPKSIKAIITTIMAISEYLQLTTVKSFTTENIREYLYENKQQKMWSNKTFINYRQYLKSFFDYCLREQFIQSNPVLRIDKPKLEKRLPRCLSKRQIDKLLLHLDCYEWYNTLDEKRNKAIFRTFLYTGLRLNELLSLKTTSINFEEYELIVYQGKGKKDRIVPIHHSLMPYLKSYKHQKRKKPTEYFFSSIRSDSPLTEKNLYRIVGKLRKACGFHFAPHMLRHTFGKLSIEANLNPFKLKEIMGHSDIQTTQIYISVSTKNIKESFQKLDLI